MYKGGLAGFYLNQGAMEMLYSALGPVGEALNGLHQKDLRWKMAWMKNPLNANALYYWLSVRPEEEAFKLLYLPVKATWGVLARGGAPLITKATYQEWNRKTKEYEIKTGYMFEPALKLSQAAHAFGDRLDKAAGISFNKNIFNSYEDFINSRLKFALFQFGEAKKDYLSSRISAESSTREKYKENLKQSRRNLRLLLDEHDGFYRWYFDKKTGKYREIVELPFWRRAAFDAAGVSRAAFKNAFRHLGRRLKNTHQDPISYLATLIVGTVFDFTVGLAGNIVRVAVNRIINAVPGLNTFRAQLVEFFTNSRIINTARIGGATVGNFGRALVSPTSFSSGYAGSWLAAKWANVLGLPVLPAQIIGGGIGYGLGAFYRTSLNLVNDLRYFNPQGSGWVQEYNQFLAKGDLEAIKGQYIKGFKPGLFSKFANFLHNNWWFRMPVNGFAIADLGVKFLHWNPIIAYPSCMAADWLWQVRGTLGQMFGKWLGNQLLPVRTWFTENVFYRPIAWEESRLLGKMPVQWGLRPFWRFLQNAWSQIQPYAGNWINPGLFSGFNLIQPLISAGMNPFAAWFIGPAAGSAVWLLSSRIIQAAIGAGVGFMSSFNAWGWAGYMFGTVLDWIIPGPSLGLGPIFTVVFPIAGSILALFHISLGAILESGLAAIASGTSALAGLASSVLSGITFMTTLGPVLAVVGLTVFTVWTLYSAFWVPMQEYVHAGPTSNYFNINTDVTKIAQGQYRLCSSFNVTNPLFNLKNYLEHDFDFSNTSLTVNIANIATAKTVQVSRNTTNLIYNANLGVDTNWFSVLFPNSVLDPQRIIICGFLPTDRLTSYLSAPYADSASLFDQALQHQEAANIVGQFIEVLQKLAADKANNTNYYLDELQANHDLLNGAHTVPGAINNLNALLATIKSAVKSTDINQIISLLSTAQGQIPVFGSNPPINPPGTNTCDGTDSRCQEHYSNMGQIYNSWSGFFSSYSDSITSLLNLTQQNNPNLGQINSQLKTLQSTLEDNLANLVQQKDLLNQMINQSKDAKNGLSSADISFINSPDINNWTKLPQNQLEQLKGILQDAFKQAFSNDEYFYIPSGTNYRVCVDTNYCNGADYDGNPPTACAGSPEPQTVCSTIMAMLGEWSFGVSSGFAKACTTFTP